MSTERDLGDSDRPILTAKEAASSVLELYKHNSKKMEKLVEVAMVTTGNIFLMDFANQPENDLISKKDSKAREWFKSGASFAYLYFEFLANNVEEKMMPQIAQKDIEKIKKEKLVMDGEQILKSAFLTGEELTLSRKDREMKLKGELDPPLRLVSEEAIIWELNRGIASPDDIKWFRTGLSMVDKLFKPYFSKQS